jgi:hypothetical protein
MLDIDRSFERTNISSGPAPQKGYVPFCRFFASCSGVRLATPRLPGNVVFFFFLAPASVPVGPDDPSGEAPRLLLTTDSPPGLGATSSSPWSMVLDGVAAKPTTLPASAQEYEMRHRPPAGFRYSVSGSDPPVDPDMRTGGMMDRLADTFMSHSQVRDPRA